MPEPTEATEDAPLIDESEIDDENLLGSVPSNSLSYFGADFDVAGLVRRLDARDIFVPQYDPDGSDGSAIEGFQRPHVWPVKRMEEFIESLLLGWPVPSIFLVLDADQRYLVLDGQQRINTLAHFYKGYYPDGKVFELRNVAENLKGVTYVTLSPEARRKLDNTFIQATVIEPKGVHGPDAVYRLFGRLNSGGMMLTSQEIRVALYRGAATNLIRELNHDINWRRLFGAQHKRLKDHELILRVLAMLEVLQKVENRWTEASVTSSAYKPPLSDFLNAYLTRHKELSIDRIGKLSKLFTAACESLVIASDVDGLKYSGSINAAHVDALLSAVMWEMAQNGSVDPSRIVAAVGILRADSSYENFITKSTSHRDSVLGRLRLASAAISRLS
ncbi:DUF262 domain-containing protein [Salinibacterium sp.]|uniref:DUF262 domain-containing protein n=1 Tax=Salinibacterium sp. TaxID=1915057 RepID=UPI00286C208B|nr:DUF262 domain-containing protein [Salinibacterium sp.]